MKLEELKPLIRDGVNVRVFLAGDLKIAFSKHRKETGYGILINLDISCEYRDITEAEIEEISEIFLQCKAYPIGTTANIILG